jgi:hypothetical protein
LVASAINPWYNEIIHNQVNAGFITDVKRIHQKLQQSHRKGSENHE